MYSPRNRTSWDKYMLKDISKYNFYGRCHFVRLRGKYTAQCTHCALEGPLKFCIVTIFFVKSMALNWNVWGPPWILAWRQFLCPTWCNLNKKAELRKLMMKLTLPVASRHQVIWVSQTQRNTSWLSSDNSVAKTISSDQTRPDQTRPDQFLNGFHQFSPFLTISHQFFPIFTCSSVLTGSYWFSPLLPGFIRFSPASPKSHQFPMVWTGSHWFSPVFSRSCYNVPI